MANDHYVAKTYLKHFVGPSGMIRAYRKPDGATFPCWPRDICAEPGGDHIPDFLSEPRYLGDYRAEFEREWNHAVSALKRRELGKQDKLRIAGYWAQLLVCTPAWTRVGVKIHDQGIAHTIAAHCAILAQRGEPDKELQEAVDAMERGEIRLETERDFVRAQSARNVRNFAWQIYNAEIDVFENECDIEFLTSDNPASFEDQGDQWIPPGFYTPFVRYLPVTPKLCLMCDLTASIRAIRDRQCNFALEPLGTIRGVVVGRGMVERVNACTAKCAEELVLASAESDYARDLSARYARFRIETESARFPESKGYIVANRIRCVEK